MISTAVFSRYARSLAAVVAEQGMESQVGADLELYGRIFDAVPDLLHTFSSPAVPLESKRKVLKQLLESYPVSAPSANFLRVLLEHNRIQHFRQVVELYGRVLDEHKGVVTAVVTSAAPLVAPEMSGLSARLSEVTGKAVKLKILTDPELLGGLVVQVGSTVYDGSIRRQLSEMKRHFLG